MKPLLTTEERKTSAGLPALTVRGTGSFSVAKTFDCGQAFRFEPCGGDPAFVRGTAFGREIAFDGRVHGELALIGADRADFDAIWRSYLDLDTDYEEGEHVILAAMPDERSRRVMQAALDAGRGIRILRQDPWETLVTFILSQNNNIPRIKKLVARLAEAAGRFPLPADLLSIGTEGLYVLGAGYRCGYLTDAAEKVLAGEVCLSRAASLPPDEARAELMKIRGVGPKVADCVLLFGLHKTEAFPVDVWIKKALAEKFPEGFDPAPLGEWAGYAQQCLFYAQREGS
ncbi:MAG: DNA-3-methyladenine glycosylase 2 family protein [Clostridia bacterium]|nr:DNA-3-methyladenine glycosylase 2 family protein [Clostridia bacterium]